jgi:hypothetical protein
VSGSECEERRDSGKMGTVKRDEGRVKRRESVTRRESKNLTNCSYVQLILYSTKHKVVVIRSSSLQLTTTLAQQSPLSASVN